MRRFIVELTIKKINLCFSLLLLFILTTLLIITYFNKDGNWKLISSLLSAIILIIRIDLSYFKNK